MATLTYLLALGRTGLKEVATQNIQKAHYIKKELSKIPGYEILNKKPTYNEFLVKCPNIDSLINICKQRDLQPPLKISSYYPEMKDIALICVTEMNSKNSIDTFLEIARLVSNNKTEGE